MARLFEDPRLLPKWMDDLERVEPVDSAGIHAGARFRMVPREGTLVFVGRVVDRDPPVRTRLALDGPTVSVAVTGTSARLSDVKTRFESEEVFTFKGLFGQLLGWFGRWSIGARTSAMSRRSSASPRASKDQPRAIVPSRICAHGTKPAFCSVLRDATFRGLQRAPGCSPARRRSASAPEPDTTRTRDRDGPRQPPCRCRHTDGCSGTGCLLLPPSCRPASAATRDRRHAPPCSGGWRARTSRSATRHLLMAAWSSTGHETRWLR